MKHILFAVITLAACNPVAASAPSKHFLPPIKEVSKETVLVTAPSALTVTTGTTGTTDAVPCVCTVLPENRYRTEMKNRQPNSAPAKVITVQEMLAWDMPAGFEDKKVRGSLEAIPGQEQTVWVVEGWIQLAKLEDDDCDLHMEVTQERDSTDRVIFEIPQGPEYQQARQRLLTALGGTISNHKTKMQPLHIRATGFGFVDSAHYSKSEPKKGHAHGSVAVQTLWELHPVWGIEIL